VDEEFSVSEDFVGMYALDQTTAESIFNALKDVLVRCNLDKNNCHGQAYDGASAMAGHISGVARRMLDEVPAALFVHCYAHKLNLVLQDVCKNVVIMRDVQEFCRDITNFIKLAPKCLVTFKNFNKSLQYNTMMMTSQGCSHFLPQGSQHATLRTFPC